MSSDRNVPFTVSRTDQLSLRVEVIVPRDTPNWEWWVMLSSDRHHDNVHCRQKKELKDLKLALRRQAAIVDFGDLFCAMQGQWDPRQSKAQTPQELMADDYLLKLIDYHADFYEPYIHLFVQCAHGNHEYAINKRSGTNLTAHFLREMKHRVPSAQVQEQPYHGWVQFQFKWSSSCSDSKKLRYTHGYGGGGPVTKDAIQANRQLVYTELADFLVSGHTHDAWYIPYKRHLLDDLGKVRYHLTKCLKVPGYKDDFEGGEGWTQTKGHPPKPIGCWWIRFWRNDDTIHTQLIEDFE